MIADGVEAAAVDPPGRLGQQQVGLGAAQDQHRAGDAVPVLPQPLALLRRGQI